MISHGKNIFGGYLHLHGLKYHFAAASIYLAECMQVQEISTHLYIFLLIYFSYTFLEYLEARICIVYCIGYAMFTVIIVQLIFHGLFRILEQSGYSAQNPKILPIFFSQDTSISYGGITYTSNYCWNVCTYLSEFWVFTCYLGQTLAREQVQTSSQQVQSNVVFTIFEHYVHQQLIIYTVAVTSVSKCLQQCKI